MAKHIKESMVKGGGSNPAPNEAKPNVIPPSQKQNMKSLVQIALWSRFEKIGLKNQVDERVKKLGLGESVFDLELGFELDENWPVGEGCEVLLSQLVVLGHKLKLNIIITGLTMEPVKE